MTTGELVGGSGSAPDSGEQERLFAAGIGPRWDPHYRHAFQRFQSGRRRLKISWNWAAALVPFWFLYRRMPLAQVMSFFLLLVVMGSVGVTYYVKQGHSAVVGGDVRWVWLTAIVAVSALKGLFGDGLLFETLREKLQPAPEAGYSEETLVKALEGRRPPRVAGGFGEFAGFVGLAFVLALSGTVLFLSWSVITMHKTSDEAAAEVNVKEDLRRLSGAQESYLAGHGTYAASLGALGITYDSLVDGHPVLVPVRVKIETANTTGWSATGKHHRYPVRCGIFVGSARSPIAGAHEGEVTCVW